MIKQILNDNEKKLPNSKELHILKEHFPSCFDSEGKFDIEVFKKKIGDKIDIKNEGYELNFLGKNYARLLAATDTETVIIPDEKHNNKTENKNSENIYISGDNLDGLKHLLKSYSGKVKCIYIDPPYNTGSDGFVYNDSFNFSSEELSLKLSISEDQAKRILDFTNKGSVSHSAWLMFMYPRLILARDLLTKNGVIFISIDDHEQADLKLICDDVFGASNFITCVSRATGTPTGGGFDGVVNELDYILVYAYDVGSLIINGLEMSKEDADIYNEIDEQGNRFLSRSLRRTGGEDRREDRPTMYYPLIAPDGSEIYPIGPTGYESRWSCKQETAKELEKKGLLIWKKKQLLNEEVWHPYQKYYLDNRTKNPGNIWTDFIYKGDSHEFLWDDIEGNKKATRDIRNLFDGLKVFETAKPIGLIKKIISIGSNENDIILDFFSGSGTTAHSVMELNAEKLLSLKYIQIQIQAPVKKDGDAEKAGFKTIDEIGQERIIRAAKQIKEKNPDITIDLGFKHYTLKEPSMKTLDKLEHFTIEDGLLVGNTVLDDFGIPTVLATWLCRDGYGFSKADILDFAGYKAFCKEKHLYLINKELSNEAITSICDKYENDITFNPENVVLFGYSFLWSEIESLKANLSRLKDIERNLKINFDIRY